MEMPANNAPSNGQEPDADVEEISVDITEDNMVWVHTEEWELVLSPEEARLLAEALQDAADEAEEEPEE